MAYIVSILYIGSLGLAFGSIQTFVVTAPGRLALVVAVMSTPLAIVLDAFKSSQRTGVAAAHLFLAVLIHPEIALDQPEYVDKAAQLELFNRIHDRNLEWSEQAYFSYELARSLMERERMSFKAHSPTKYWFYPPSLALLAWGVLAFFCFPTTDKRSVKSA
jgi:hypothetical protein